MVRKKPRVGIVRAVPTELRMRPKAHGRICLFNERIVVEFTLPGGFTRGQDSLQGDISYIETVIGIRGHIAIPIFLYGDVDRVRAGHKVKACPSIFYEPFTGKFYIEMQLLPVRSVVTGKLDVLLSTDMPIDPDVIFAHPVDDSVIQLSGVRTE